MITKAMERKVLSLEEQTERILKGMEKLYGFVPPIMKIISQRPDYFVPLSRYGKAVMENPEANIQKKTAYLCAVSAASALGGEHCVNVQVQNAVNSGATKEEIFEAMMVGTYMAMTKAQSYALRKFDALFPRDEEDGE